MACSCFAVNKVVDILTLYPGLSAVNLSVHSCQRTHPHWIDCSFN